MKKSELKIFYAGGLNEDLDNELERVLGAFGYERWASGLEIESGVRDIAFDRSGHNTTDAEGDKVFRMPT